MSAIEIHAWEEYRHKKRGTTYTVMGFATLQVDGPLDNERVVIYQSEKDGLMWVRPVSEFADGRFECAHPQNYDLSDASTGRRIHQQETKP